jgi:hypothetical protein
MSSAQTHKAHRESRSSLKREESVENKFLSARKQERRASTEEITTMH